MRFKVLHSIGMAAVLLFAPGTALAEPTNITVRVMSKDAKYIGSSMGGMQIVVRDALTKTILATGLTSGGTGDTKRLMHTNAGRRAVLSDATAAKFEAVIDLQSPTLIEVEAIGPLAQMQSANRASSTQWVVPGRHITGGDGWVLELPGFVVDVLSPPAHIRLGAVKSVDIKANVVMMCGCPIEPKGLWDASAYEVKAIVTRNGKEVARHDMIYAGATSQFAASIPVEDDGVYDVLVYAYDPANGNTGIDRTTFFAGK
jgi:hypothetical protein